MSLVKAPELPPLSAAPVSIPFRKLRDSCCNCAKAKLRCSKDKPECARCVRQGKTCFYVLSKRAGRTRAVRSGKRETEDVKSPIPVRPMTSSSEIAMPSSSEVTMSPASTLPESMQAQMPQSSPIYPNNIAGVVPLNEEPVIPSPSAYTPQFFDMTGISMHYPAFGSIDDTNHLEVESVNAPSYINSDAHYSLFPSPKYGLALPQGLVSNPSTFRTATQPVISPASDSELDIPPTPTDPPLRPQCSCLSRVLGLLQQLSAAPSGRPRSSPIPGPVKQHPNETSYRDAENKKYVEEALNMVECSCSEDPYLLSLTGLLAFKIMNLYKITARELRNPGSTNEQYLAYPNFKMPTIRGYSYPTHNVRIRSTAQSFLGEVRLVQQLVSSLSLRLRRLGAGGSREQNATSNIYDAGYVPGAHSSKDALRNTEENGSLSLPATLLYQLDVDLRRDLRAMTIEVLGGG
ncbi:hypothetical protein F4678DRAFT_322637 [Xylaria arbuscula]|nr:hypothetical protein F4678DRAFT_322637 [Xylaria arbuscula]